MPLPPVRKGQAPAPHTREQFRERFMQSFYDPAFDAEREAIARLEAIAWDGYTQARKSPRTRKAGPGFESGRPGSLIPLVTGRKRPSAWKPGLPSC